MEAQYDFLPVPGTKNGEKNPKLYPKLVTRGAIPFSDIIRQIARSSGFKEGTVIGEMDIFLYFQRRMCRNRTHGLCGS